MELPGSQSYHATLAGIERNAVRDRRLIILLCLVGFIFASIVDLFEVIYQLVHRYESFELDELLMLSFFVSLGLIAYSVRRNRELCHINHLIEQYATTDSLTGLLNRGHLSALLEHELAMADRYKTPLTLLWLDIDNFKQINDHCGHVEADKLLYRMAGALSANLRDSDLLGRMGGDEFLLVLPSTSLEEAQQVAERQLEHIGMVESDLPGCKALLSASIGVTRYHPGEPLDVLLHRLDEAMYRAKHEGKNRVVLVG